jgi:HAD superfamily hydrolase (TIGR01509 family)
MDGLMLDTERPARRAWIQAAAAHGFALTDEIIFRTIGVAEGAVKSVYDEAFGPPFPYEEIRQEVKRLIAEEIEREGVPLRPGLLTLLDHLAQQGIPCAVASSTASERALWKLEKAGIKSYFSAFAFGDEVANGKPAPDIFLLAAARVDAAPADCVGFEDSPAGLSGLQRAGIRSVFVKDLIEPDAAVLAGVWRRYTSLAEALPLFPSLREI